MKHIKQFLKFEAVIIPDEIESGAYIRDMNDLVEYGDSNDFDVVEYDEFLQSLPQEDKLTAPPKFGNPFFALFHPIRRKPMFVICDKMAIRMMPNFKEIVDDIISHERIHGEQNIRRSGLTFRLPNPTEKKKYFSNKDEIMAFSWTIAQGLHKEYDNFDEAIKSLGEVYRAPRMPMGPPPGGRNMPPPMGGRNMPEMPKVHKMLWNDIKDNCDADVINRYKKYIFSYLKQLYTI